MRDSGYYDRQIERERRIVMVGAPAGGLAALLILQISPGAGMVSLALLSLIVLGCRFRWRRLEAAERQPLPDDGLHTPQRFVAPANPTDQIVFRPRGWRAAMWIAAIGSLAMFTGAAASGPGPDPQPGDWIWVLGMGVVFVLGFVRAARMRVVMDEYGVTVYRYLSTRMVLWAHIARAEADYSGLHLELVNGEIVTAAVLGKPNWAVWFRRTTIADRVVDHINARTQPT